MKKGLVMLMLISMLAVAVAGCGKKSEEAKDSKTTEATEDKKEKNEDKKADESEEKTDEDDISKYDLSQGVVIDTGDVSAESIADLLKTNIDYTDELMEVSLEKASMFYDFTGIKIDEACLYESSGATAEEIVVLKCADSQSVEAAKTVLSNRVSEQIESFKDYVPEELTKLKSAVIISNSNYAILSVSDDPSGAKEVIEKMLAQ